MNRKGTFLMIGLVSLLLTAGALFVGCKSGCGGDCYTDSGIGRGTICDEAGCAARTVDTACDC